MFVGEAPFVMRSGWNVHSRNSTWSFKAFKLSRYLPFVSACLYSR